MEIIYNTIYLSLIMSTSAKPRALQDWLRLLEDLYGENKLTFFKYICER